MPSVPFDSDIFALSGRQGDVVYAQRGGRTVVRRFVPPSQPDTPAQRARRQSMAAAATAWAGLTPEQVAAWNAWAKTHPRRNRLTDRSYTPSAYNAFQSLALKLLQADPQAAPSPWPPTGPFLSDTVSITVLPGAGAIVWTPSAPNAAHVATELLTQPLVKVQGRPTRDKYRTRLFVTFAAPPFAIETPCAPGLWACATRFVDLTTGQAMPLRELPPVWVGAYTR